MKSYPFTDSSQTDRNRLHLFISNSRTSWFIFAHDHTIIFSFIPTYRCLYKYTWLKRNNLNGSQEVSPSHPNTDCLNLEDQWTLLLKDPEYSSYSVLALSPCHKIIAFGNLKGKIKLQDAGEWQPTYAIFGKTVNWCFCIFLIPMILPAGIFCLWGSVFA